MNVYFDTIGCRLNQSEIEQYANQFRLAGHHIVMTAAEADMVIINTCTVTVEAASDSRQKIRQAARAGNAQIVLTGCWSTMEPDDAALMEHVTHIIPNHEKDQLVATVLSQPQELFDREPLAREPLPGIHQRTRAFLKAQDGCDNHCTYCITHIARGAGRSRLLAEVLKDAHAAVEGGSKELVLTGVHLASWGKDFDPPLTLRNLVQAVLDQGGMQRLRLSSVEPWDLHDNFFAVWADGRMCRHIHLPLQSGSAGVLRRMARNTTPTAYRTLVETIRRMVPQVAITTDIIVGFPGETEDEFSESLEFVREISFAAGHVFAYSARNGTPAARMTGQIPHAIRKERSRKMRDVIAASSLEYRQQFIGTQTSVLWESTDGLGSQGWRLQGLTDNYLRISASSKFKLWNQISRVKILAIQGDGFSGEIID